MYQHATKNIDDLALYGNNARLHSDQQVQQIVASITEWGFTNPVLIDEGNAVIAGHGRLRAARILAIDDIPCIVLDGLTEAQKRAYIIADNKLALNATWDYDMLQVELNDLQTLDFDIDLIGLTRSDKNNLMLDEESKFDGVNVDQTRQYLVQIQCEGEKEQIEMIEKLTAEGIECQALIY